MLRITCLLAFAALALVGCSDISEDVNRSPSATAVSERSSADIAYPATQTRPDGWDDYWYSGLAEVNSYSVQQERYGELRNASAVLIFVTEDFLPETQVKDDGKPSKETAISVFKQNRVEKFTTGIYDYSLMLSTFTPVSYNEHPNTLKSTFSSQDWCGHVWQQTNRRGAKFQVETRSYFQTEADMRTALNADFLEDELVSRVRVDPASLPSGKTKLVPAAKFSRLRHVEPAAEDATVSFGPSGNGLVLQIDYPRLDRHVIYRFAEAFPHKLLGWAETYKGNTLSEGTLDKSIRTAYWGQNSTQYDGLRDTLGI